MGKLDHNLDAYRAAATALERLRQLLRRHLEAAHGTDWESTGIPGEPGEFLEQRRDRENSVKWNAASGCDLLDYAGFVNLYEVLMSHPRLREGFARLVPDPHTLRLRFLELDTVLNRIAYARPVSESDMELLLGFDERLRQLASDLTVGSPGSGNESEREAPAEGAQATVAKRSQRPAPRQPEPPAPTRAERKPAAAPQPAPPAPEDRAAERRPEPERPQPARPAPVEPHKPQPARPARPDPGVDVPPAPNTKDIESAIRRGDDAVLLNALYLEITGLAEKLWSDGDSPGSPVWQAVSESPWYRERFSSLRLKVISDFYDLLRTVREHRAAGKGRSELHELLKERNFAQLLMDLREFFKPLVTAGQRGSRTAS